MVPNGFSTYPMGSILLWILMVCLFTWVNRRMALKIHPLRADPSLQYPGRESVEDFYYSISNVRP